MKTTLHRLTGQELATVLAALRYYQLNGLADYPALRPDAIHDIAGGGDNADFIASLDGAALDRLCEHLNLDGTPEPTPAATPLVAIPRPMVSLLREISRACKMPAPCGIGSYAIGERRMRRLRRLVRRLTQGSEGGEPALLAAAKALLANADDRGETHDRDTREEYADWAALRAAIADEEGRP